MALSRARLALAEGSGAPYRWENVAKGMIAAGSTSYRFQLSLLKMQNRSISREDFPVP
jgi:hypothetical protein